MAGNSGIVIEVIEHDSPEILIVLAGNGHDSNVFYVKSTYNR